ncbi:uncharacterized protein PAC_14622 [Phialocephala subalpina]|uniref:Uncharacterized protein n=1 Tax=Phialocephala subalpina TaxID=576137 RepID=A0A1L7XI62_9HELO|nr:uncharacterized protein PAC_14622 [Phialocephala subalpina]
MSRLKNLFFGRASVGNPNLKGQSYDNHVAREPPVKGSYPVAGNGPNVLEEIQRSRVKRDTRGQSAAGSIAAAPSVPRYREDPIERPRTAPNDGKQKDFGSGSNGNGGGDGRTRSFSMISAPRFFNNSRRNSLRSTAESLPPVPTINSPPQSTKPKPPRDVQTYQPRTGADVEQYNGFTPPFARHIRSDSHASHKSYVDLLEAHSNIAGSRETSRHRAKASGVRNYGEDVADRNMARDREARLDLDSPEFSYLKTVYSPKKPLGVILDGGHSRTSSALGHVLGHDADPSDDIQPHGRHSKAASIRSTTTTPRSGFRSRIDTPSVYSYDGDDDRPASRVNARGPRGRALSSLSTSSIQQPSVRESLRQSAGTPDRGRRTLREPPAVASSSKQPAPKAYKQTASTPRVAPVPENRQPATAPSVAPSRVLKEPPPVASPEDLPRVTIFTHERRASNSSAKQRQRTMSASSQTTTTSNGHASRSSYSAFPTSPSSATTKSPTSLANKRAGMLVEERSKPISLEGVVDLTSTVDTDVTTKTLPAVTHEHVTPTRHEIREERITREIHTHDVYHRILPVIETEILPTKHFVPSGDGKGLTEIPESELYKYTQHTVTGKPNGNWQIVKDARPRKQSLSQSIYSHTNIDEDDGAEGPVIGLARGEPTTRSRPGSRASTATGSRSKNILEPILSSKKEYMTKEGHPKTEYVWRHPPVFEDIHGRTQPVYIGAGLGDISPQNGYQSDSDTAGAEFGAERQPAKGEEGLLFRDSGYGSQGMLPGLGQSAPMSEFQNTNGHRKSVAGVQHMNGYHKKGLNGINGTHSRKSSVEMNGDVVGDYGEKIRLGKVLNHSEQMEMSEGQATKALRRMKERRRSSAASAASKGKGKEVDMDGLVDGVNGMHVRWSG